MMFVQWNQLIFLFRWCFQCGAPCEISKIVSTGASISVNTNCDRGHENNWNSLANEGQFHEGHVTLAASILLLGLSYQRFSEAMEIGNIEFFHKDTFYRLQKKFLFPAINNVYVYQARKLIKELKCDEIVPLIGDGRCDSPGYSATYGTYSLMNEKDNRIVDFFIAHVKIVGSSQGMKKYGLEYSIKYFEPCGVDIDILTTDEHKQIRCFLRKEYPEICHQFDIWHQAKNLKKKLVKISLKKETKDLQLWIRAVINHFWWSCTTCNEDVDSERQMDQYLVPHP